MLLAGEGKASDEVDCAADRTAASVQTDADADTNADTDIDSCAADGQETAI